MQCRKEDLREKLTDIEGLQPVMYMSGQFTKSEERYHIAQKELLPLIQLYKKYRYLVVGHPRALQVYTDHRNLLPLLRPEWGIKAGQIDRLKRWALLLQAADLVVRHVQGTDNVLPDMLSRWAKEKPDIGEDREIWNQAVAAVKALYRQEEEKEEARVQGEEAVELHDVNYMEWEWEVQMAKTNECETPDFQFSDEETESVVNEEETQEYQQYVVTQEEAKRLEEENLVPEILEINQEDAMARRPEVTR